MLPSQKLNNIRVRNLGKWGEGKGEEKGEEREGDDVCTLELLSDGQLEQLELLQSSDSYSIRSYEVGQGGVVRCKGSHCCVFQASIDLHLRSRCHGCLRNHWKLTLIAAMIVFFIVVSCSS